MNRLLNWIEANLGKLISFPLSVTSIQFIVTLFHMMNDGAISHEEFEALMQAGNGTSMILLALALAFIKLKK